MKILFAAAEAAPFIKTGGLGDVIGSLPKALLNRGVEVRVILPKHRDIKEEFRNGVQLRKIFNVSLGWRNQYCGIEEVEYNGVIFYFIDNEYYFKREELYGYGDDAERYAFYSEAVLEALPLLDYRPDIIHCHDWHAGLISLMLKAHYGKQGFYKDIKTLFTIHNLQYQGVFRKEILEDMLDIGQEFYGVEGLEYYGNVNCMKGGIVFSDLISTVSKSYAEEIKTSYYGEGLNGILTKRQGELFGIVNGIDYDEYNPAKDSLIFNNYNDLQGKRKNKEMLQKVLELPVNGEVPVIGIVSRLANGKGMDLIVHVLEEILTMDVQIVILGTGEHRYEELFKVASLKQKSKVSSNICFNNGLAHRIYAGSDIFLMPSKYEPCGLGQLIALRYGTIPIVRETGGLKDTVRNFDESSGTGNGFSFTNYNAHEMLREIERAVKLYQNKELWENLFKNAISCDFSWNQSAGEYIYLYNRLIS